MNNIMDGKKISNEILENIKQELKYELIKQSLAVIQIGNDPASEKYVKNKQKACEDVGIFFRHHYFEDNTSELTIINKIKELNNDEYVHGIIIQLPIPEHYNTKRLINSIINSKDVDGLTDINAGRLVNNKKTLIPCTALGVMELLKRYEIDLAGKEVVIVGKGKLTGKPLIEMFLQAGATVTVCHSKTNNLSSHTKTADIIVSATGVNNLIKQNMVKKDAIVIDVGINFDKGKQSGDVDFDKVSKVASLITPNPGGVGPMTVAMLIQNVMTCFRSKKK